MRLRRSEHVFVALAVVIHEVHQAAHEVDAEAAKFALLERSVQVGRRRVVRIEGAASVFHLYVQLRGPGFHHETVIVCPAGSS